METQRYVQQNAATTHPPTDRRRAPQSPAGSTRSIAGRSDVRIDPAQRQVRAPRSRAEQLSKFVAQFQAEKARHPGNVGADLKEHLPSLPPMVNQATPANRAGLAPADQQKVEAAIEAIDRGRRQFSHAAAISRKPATDIQSVKAPFPTSTQSGIVSTVSQAISSEVVASAPAQQPPTQQPRVAPVAAIRQPFFANPSGAADSRPEVVFEEANSAATNQAANPATPTNPATAPAASATLSANGLEAESAFHATWQAAQLNPKPMINLAVRETQDTEVVALPESVLRDIADQHRDFDAKEAAAQHAVAPVTQTTSQGNVGDEIPVDLAAWDVEALRWSKVTDDILAHAGPAMDQLTHYTLDILAGAENRIAIAGLKRGQGTSTIAAAVTRWAVSNGKRVLLVDADLGNPELSRSAGLSPNVSWLNLLREDLIPSEAIIRSKSSGVCIMPLAAVVTPQTWPGPIYDRLGALIDQVRHGFDLILMDVGPVGQLSNELSASDLMLDALMIVDENPSSGEFVAAKSRLLKSGVRKFIAAQNSTGTETI